MKRILIISLLTCLVAGCNEDDRLVKLSQEHAARQAEQNLTMAELNKSVADGAKRLVEAESEARGKLLAMQDNLRADQAAIGQQRDQLEGERQEIANQRNREPIVAAAIVQASLVLASLLPLILAGYLLYSLRHAATQDDAVVTELLVAELFSEHPQLLLPNAAPAETRQLMLAAGDPES